MNKNYLSGIGIIVLAMLLVFTAPATATNVAYLDPDPSCAAPGETTYVEMRLNSTEGVTSMEMNIYFDPDVLNITDMQPGDFPNQFCWCNWGNYVAVGGVTSNWMDLPPGDYLFVNMTVEANNTGTSVLGDYKKHHLWDEYFNEIFDVVWLDGTFECTGSSEVDNKTTEDISVSGTVSGSYIDTHESDDVYESITEVLSTGKPAWKQYSYLEHKWTIDVIDGSKTNVTLYLEACHSSSSDGDDFVFAYSADDNTYTDMVTVIKTDDNNAYQTYELPNDLSGTVHIRVKDTDRNKGNQGFDTVYIDQMFIRSVLAPPSYGVTVTIDEASQTVAPGSGTTYTVRVKNTGDLDASYSVEMSGTAVTDATIGVSPLNWNTGTLAPNDENVRIVTVSTNSSTPETTYTLTATATGDQDAGVTDSATSDLVVSSVTNAMHIASIDMSFKTAGPNINAIALVTIVDAAGAPVGDATVEGHWSGATSDTDSGLTGTSGEVTLDSDKVRNAPSGTVFTFTVDDVSLAGWTYDPAANMETSGSITVP